jgi:hypothetical protein
MSCQPSMTARGRNASYHVSSGASCNKEIYSCKQQGTCNTGLDEVCSSISSFFHTVIRFYDNWPLNRFTINTVTFPVSVRMNKIITKLATSSSTLPNSVLFYKSGYLCAEFLDVEINYLHEV